MKYPLRSDYEDDEFHLAHAGPFVFMNWRGSYRAEAFPRIEEVHLRLAGRRRYPLTGVSVVEADSPIPDEDIRLAGADMMTRTAETTKAVVIIFLDQGFTASALQSVAARELSLGGRVSIRFFHDIPGAAQWLTQLYPKLEMVPQDVELLIDKLRQRFSPSRLPGPPSSGNDSWSSRPPASDSATPSNGKTSGVPAARSSERPPAERSSDRPPAERKSERPPTERGSERPAAPPRVGRASERPGTGSDRPTPRTPRTPTKKRI
ncbi:MAG TPA: hypothetical protein VN764_20190 [Polyangiaceae bacterium]|nr:hypothetical protein [Polyangiaceae bacterium]